MIAKIPIAHIHGGEITEGSWDDSIRHCITKMSHLHFTATEEYKNRVIQLGEVPSRVYNTGGMGIENIKRLKLLSKTQFEKSINFKLNQKNIKNLELQDKLVISTKKIKGFHNYLILDDIPKKITHITEKINLMFRPTYLF